MKNILRELEPISNDLQDHEQKNLTKLNIILFIKTNKDLFLNSCPFDYPLVLKNKIKILCENNDYLETVISLTLEEIELLKSIKLKILKLKMNKQIFLYTNFFDLIWNLKSDYEFENSFIELKHNFIKKIPACKVINQEIYYASDVNKILDNKIEFLSYKGKKLPEHHLFIINKLQHDQELMFNYLNKKNNIIYFDEKFLDKAIKLKVFE